MIDVAFSEQPYLWLAMYNLLYRFNITELRQARGMLELVINQLRKVWEVYMYSLYNFQDWAFKHE